MSTPVLAVFSGTDVDQDTFERALAVAREEHRPLLLLDVRHERRAARLENYLDAGSPLGRTAVKALSRSIKRQRDRAIEQAMEAMARRAGEMGVEVSVRQEKGPFETAVIRAARASGAAVVVLPQDSECRTLAREFPTLSG